MSASIGALRITLGANTAQYEAGMRRAGASARRTGREISTSMSAAQRTSTAAFAGMVRGAALLGVALGAGALANYGRSALNMAADLTETARSIGVTVEQLQILRRAAIENGSSAEVMGRSIAILNRTLGQARAGVPAAVRSFQSLRIDPRQFASAGEVIPRVMEAIKRLGTQSEQAAAAQRLMGRGAAEMIPFLIQGAEGYNRMARETRAAGVVTAEMAERADYASDRLKALGQTLQVNLAIGLIGVLDPIMDVISGLGRIGTAAMNAAQRIMYAIGLQGQLNAGAAAAPSAPTFWGDVQSGARTGTVAGGGLGGMIVGGILGGVRNLGRADPAQVAARRTSRRRIPPPPTLDLSSGGGGGRSRSGGGGGGGGGDPNRAADDAARRRFDVESELRRARIDELRATEAAADSAEQRHETALMISYLEQEQEQAARTLSVIVRDRTQLEADTLADKEDSVRHIQRAASERDEARRLIRERAEIDDAAFDIAEQELRSQSELADTAAERREIELELLDLTRRHRAAKLRAVLAENSGAEAGERAIAQLQLDALQGSANRERAGVMRGTMGPLGQFLADLPTTAGRANEALQAIAANGLQSITDGLADAIMMTRSWGDVMKNVVKQIISDLIRMQIQRSIVGPLANALAGIFAGSAGGSGGLVGMGSIGRRAAGGPVVPGRMYMVGERGPELIRMGNMGGQVIPNNALGGGGRVVVELNDAMLNARIVEGSVEVVRAAAPGMVDAAKGATIRELRRPRLS